MLFRRSYQKAFSLPEVVIAMSVLILVVTAATDLLVSIIRNNNENVNTLVAYELAQEGVEGARNIRDSNWLLGADFQGKIGVHVLWGVSLPVDGDPQYYQIDANVIDQSFCTSNVDLTTIAECAPWKLKNLSLVAGQSEPDQQSTLLYVHKSNNTVQYVHHVEPGDTKSIFHRYLKIVALPYENNLQKYLKYRVSSIVTWKEGARDKNVTLMTELTDWKGGPL